MRLLEPTAQIWMKIDPYYQPQKCRPMNLVSENIRFMRIFAGVPLGAGVKRHWGLSTTAIFGYLAGYVFENVRDTASNIIWRYRICYPLSTGKWMQNEWPWMTLSGYFMTKCVFAQHFLNQSVWMSEIVQPQRFGVTVHWTCTVIMLRWLSAWLLLSTGRLLNVLYRSIAILTTKCQWDLNYLHNWLSMFQPL